MHTAEPEENINYIAGRRSSFEVMQKFLQNSMPLLCGSIKFKFCRSCLLICNSVTPALSTSATATV